MNLFRLYQQVRHPYVHRVLSRLRRTQYWSRDEVRGYQFEKLRKLLFHAYDQVPYYRRQFEICGATPHDIQSFDDFSRLPILTKAAIRENRSSLVALNVAKAKLVPNATGGSTGEPLQYFQDQHYELWADAARIRGWYEIAGCRQGDRCAVLWGAMHDLRSNFSRTERLRDRLLYGELKLNSFNLSNQRMTAFLKSCEAFRPKLLRGYFTAIKEFARFLDENNLSFPPLKGIVLCAETVDEESQRYVEEVFQASSYNTYGGREVSLIAMECGAHSGLHEVSENNYVEFEPIELPGYSNAGNLIVTNLNNYAMPFIRYRIGDIAVPSSRESCCCGRGLPLIAKIIGRTTDVFEFYDGTKIAGEMFIHLMKEFPIREYQFVQVSDRKVLLRISHADAQERVLWTRIREAYRPYLPVGVELECEEVDAFQRTATGKFRFVFRSQTN